MLQEMECGMDLTVPLAVALERKGDSEGVFSLSCSVFSAYVLP